MTRRSTVRASHSRESSGPSGLRLSGPMCTRGVRAPEGNVCLSSGRVHPAPIFTFASPVKHAAYYAGTRQAAFIAGML